MPELQLIKETIENEFPKRKVAIIIPTHNNLKWLKQTINSIFLTTDYPHYRILIIESESTDGTKEYLELLKQEYPEKIEIFNIIKEGSIKACNFGLMQLEENEDAYLTQDDVMFYPYRDWLKDYVTYAERKDAGVITSCGAGISGSSYIDGLIWVGSWDMYITNQALQKIGIFDVNMQIGEDIDYAYRLRKEGLNIINFNDPVTIVHHQRRETHHAIQSEELKRKNEQYFREKHKL